MKKKILHVVGGNFSNGAFQGAQILHNELIDQGIDSKILNDVFQDNVEIDKNVISINNNFFTRIKSKIFIIIEKFF